MSDRISVLPAKIKWDQITPWWRIFRLTRDCMLRPSLLCCLQFGQRLKLAFISAAAAACPNGSFFEPDIRNLPLLLCTIKHFLVGWAQGSQKEENGGNGVCRHNSIQSNRTAICALLEGKRYRWEENRNTLWHFCWHFQNSAHHSPAAAVEAIIDASRLLSKIAAIRILKPVFSFVHASWWWQFVQWLVIGIW